MKCFELIEEHSVREKHIFAWAGAIALLLLIADQWSKWFFVRNFRLGESLALIPGWLNFTYVHNLGAAWSIFSGQVLMLLIFGIAAAAAMIIFFRKLAEKCPERYFALLMILSGIAGNCFDRAFHGAVVDFIHVHYYNIWHYPVFNVADMAICTGVGIFLLSSFLRKSPEKEKK